MITASHLEVLAEIKRLTDKRAGLDYGGREHNKKKRRLVQEMIADGLLVTSAKTPERCVVGLTPAGLAALNPLPSLSDINPTIDKPSGYPIEHGRKEEGK